MMWSDSSDSAGSNIKHIEEIREAGLEMPVVNQIEVRMSLSSGAVGSHW